MQNTQVKRNSAFPGKPIYSEAALSWWYSAQVHFFHFRPLPQGQGSLRPTLIFFRVGCF
jgi:hypothetical protein